jgi:hypothetical protein
VTKPVPTVRTARSANTRQAQALAEEIAAMPTPADVAAGMRGLA